MKIGIIGSSSGNGHPFSWSAIMNGYQHGLENYCDFPIIPEYLSQEKWPLSSFKEVEVVAIWTQNRSLSGRIATFAKISQIKDDYRSFLGDVDAVIVARDDCKNHYEFARFFLNQNIPIFLDKPIAISEIEFQKLMKLPNAKEKLFSSTSVLYSGRYKEFQEKLISKLRNRQVTSIYAETPNEWIKYSPHIVEPVISTISEEFGVPQFVSKSDNANGTTLKLALDDLSIVFRTTGASAGKIKFSFDTLEENMCVTIDDTFFSFSSILQDFLFFAQTSNRRVSVDLENSVKVIEMGNG